MHRWVWDLHAPSPASMRHDYPIAAIAHDTPRGPLGPTALPGTYQVRLTVDGKSFTAPLTVKMDPRIKTPLSGLQKKAQAETRLSDAMTETTQSILQANSINSQLEKLTQSGGAAKNAVADFQKKLNALVGAPGGFFTPPSAEVTLMRTCPFRGAISALPSSPFMKIIVPLAKCSTRL